jgi:hypothetical protein
MVMMVTLVRRVLKALRVMLALTERQAHQDQMGRTAKMHLQVFPYQSLQELH